MAREKERAQRRPGFPPSGERVRGQKPGGMNAGGNALPWSATPIAPG
jgi:hypothetical protein